MNEESQTRFADALTRLSGDVEILQTLAIIAAEDAPKLMDQLNDARRDEDWQEYAKTSHSLKGLLSTFETDEPVSRIQTLIDAARREDVQTIATTHEGLLVEIRTLVERIKQLNK